MRNRLMWNVFLGFAAGVVSGVARRLGVFALPLVALWLVACASVPTTGVNGGKLVAATSVSGRPDRTYTIGPCRRPDGQLASSLGAADYEWRRGGERSTLYEHRDGDPQGRLIDNAWQRDRAHHYFIWMAEVSGFEYVVPDDERQHGAVRRYSRPEVRAGRDGSRRRVYQPVGEPEVVCELWLQR